jgi:hypothetical protein
VVACHIRSISHALPLEQQRDIAHFGRSSLSKAKIRSMGGPRGSNSTSSECPQGERDDEALAMRITVSLGIR